MSQRFFEDSQFALASAKDFKRQPQEAGACVDLLQPSHRPRSLYPWEGGLILDDDSLAPAVSIPTLPPKGKKKQDSPMSGPYAPDRSQPIMPSPRIPKKQLPEKQFFGIQAPAQQLPEKHISETQTLRKQLSETQLSETQVLRKQLSETQALRKEALKQALKERFPEKQLPAKSPQKYMSIRNMLRIPSFYKSSRPHVPLRYILGGFGSIMIALLLVANVIAYLSNMNGVENWITHFVNLH